MKNFLLGLGAQKTGTSWLSNYLRSLNNTDFGFLKEYHVFDSRELVEFEQFKKNYINNTLKKLSSSNPLGKSGKDNLSRLSMIQDYEVYFNYFAGILAKKDCILSADITPSYAGLGVQTLKMINDSFKLRNINVIALFMMRDPVYRLKSYVSMEFRRQKVIPTHKQEIDAMQHVLKRVDVKGERTFSRGNYKSTVQNIKAVFSGNSIFIFYEELFQENTIRNLCRRLNLDYKLPEFDKPVNVSKTKNVLSDEEIKEFTYYYKDIYEFCFQQFGEERIKKLWSCSKYF